MLCAQMETHYFSEDLSMTSAEGRLKSAIFYPTQKRMTNLLRIPGLVTQPSTTDQSSFPEASKQLVGITHPLAMPSSVGVILSTIFTWHSDNLPALQRRTLASNCCCRYSY
jgi:hypothetical protein